MVALRRIQPDEAMTAVAVRKPFAVAIMICKVIGWIMITFVGLFMIAAFINLMMWTN